jgi:hypothetical protein
MRFFVWQDGQVRITENLARGERDSHAAQLRRIEYEDEKAAAKGQFLRIPSVLTILDWD